MLAYWYEGRQVLLDVDMGLGRGFGYTAPPRVGLIDDLRERLGDGRLAAPCHPDRPLFAKGQCKPCYQRAWREAKAR